MGREGAEGAVGRVGHEYLRATHHSAGAVPVAPLLAELLAGVEGLEEVVFPFVVVQLRSPDAVDPDVAPHVVRSGVDDFRARPVDQILAPVAQDAPTAGSDHYVLVRYGVGEHAVVAPVDLVERVGAVLRLGVCGRENRRRCDDSGNQSSHFIMRFVSDAKITAFHGIIQLLD